VTQVGEHENTILLSAVDYRRRVTGERVADLLQEKGLIEYLQNPNHHRAKLACVADKGRKLLDKLQARESQWARHAAGDVDVEQVEAAAVLVRSMRERLLVEPMDR